MTTKLASGSELTQLMTNHILSNIYRNKLISVMNCNGVSHKIRRNH